MVLDKDTDILPPTSHALEHHKRPFFPTLEQLSKLQRVAIDTIHILWGQYHDGRAWAFSDADLTPLSRGPFSAGKCSPRIGIWTWEREKRRRKNSSTEKSAK